MLEKFHELRKTGFSQTSIDAAINTIEFSLRENNTGRFPRGIAMMLRSMGAWIYERDPYTCVLPPPGTGSCFASCCAPDESKRLCVRKVIVWLRAWPCGRGLEHG